MNGPPTANAGADKTANEAVVGLVHRDGRRRDGDADVLTGTSGTGRHNTTGTLTPSHTYADNGTYTVTLTVTDANNQTATDTATVTVEQRRSDGDASTTTGR